MKTKQHSSLVIRDSSFIAVGTACAAAIVLFTTAARAPAQSVWGDALSFDGTNDWVQAGEVPLANSSFTLEAWVQRRSSDTMDMVVSQGTGSYNHCLMFGFHYYAGNQFLFDFYGNGVGSGTADTDSAWHHWAGTYDASSKIRCLYRDGVLIASNTNTAEDYQGSGPLKIGVGPFGEAPNEFDGQIDDVRIWNVALSQAQIAAQMTQPLSGKEPNLLAYWKFDEGSGTNIFDATSNHFDGIFKSSPEWVASTPSVPWGNALSLNQSNDYVRTTIPALASNYTVSAWVYLRGGGNNAGGNNVVGLLSATNCGSSAEVLLHGVTSSYTDSQYLQLGRCGFFSAALSTETVPLNQWVHLAVTISANKQVSYFINGNPAGSWNASAWNVTIGPDITLGDNTSRHFDGMLDDVQIWNVALSQAQIAADMTHPVGGNEPNLLAYWKFDEGADTVAHDATINHCDGTLVNNPAWVVSTVTVPPPFAYTTNGGTLTITNYTGPGWDVTIPDTINDLPVASIGDSAFYNCTSVTFVAIPDSVTSIGDDAFDSCTSLAGVSIGNSVGNIGDYAFAGCDGLTSVTIGNGVTNIGEGAFVSCTNLPGVTIPDSVINIGDIAFADCESLTNINIPDSVTNIRNYVFAACSSLANVTIPDNVTSIGDGVFDSCYNLTSITIGNSVTNIGEGAFVSCTNLPGVTIPDGVINIGYIAFADCESLTNINIPASVIHIGDIPFIDCFSLTAITVDTNNPAYTSVAGVLFNKDMSTLIEYPEGKTGTYYTVPDSVTNIENSAFYGCGNLTGITIGNNIANIGDYAFYSCQSLVSVTIPDSVTSIGDDAFDSCYSLTGVYFLGNAPNLGWDVFYDDNNATIYYFSGTTGLNPQVQTSGANFGVRTNRFGFTIAGASGLGVVVQACTNLANPTWSPVATLSFTSDLAYFGDSQWMNYPARYYRLASPTFGGRPVVLWNAQAQARDASFGVRSNRFGFTITGTADIPIVVEACTDLASGAWTPLQTGTVTNGSIYFCDPEWTNYPARFYHVRWP